MGMRGITCVKKTPPMSFREGAARRQKWSKKMIPKHKIPPPIGKRRSQRWKTVAMLVDSRAWVDSGDYGAPEGFLFKIRLFICPSQGSQDGACRGRQGF